MGKSSARQADVGDPRWYKDAVIYELHVRAFCDDDGDGIGDINGLIGKLDYLQDLGVTALWLLPFYPSPLKDDGYDIANYTEVHPAYGEMRHFRRLLREAHARDLKVITELVINHTSTEHPWFERARRAAPGSPERDFYVWTDDPERYADARIIFKDFETSNWAWDPVAGAYYWHRFYSHQPDLNFENPAVQKAILDVVDFWMKMGVDGMRLDAVPYLYEEDGTNCENLPETHVFLKRLRSHVDSHYSGRMLLAEANQWPEDAAAYFGEGDECHMNFHFPLMPRLFMSVQLESSFPIHDILEQTPAIPDSCQWALFLRNHDELTLEMVTDEDRDYMYRVFAADPAARINLGIRRRLMPLLGSRQKVELLNAVLLSLPGTPVLYYGDEIGMGDNVYLGDRNGVRTPMQWSADRNAGFSRTNPQRLFLPSITDPEYHYEAINVEAQQGNPSSLLWWMKRLIALRKQSQVFGRGDVEFLRPENGRVLAYVRSYEGAQVLVVANLSRYAQFVELDLSRYHGAVPVEMFGQTEFPRIGMSPYFLSLGPHQFYWFSLTRQPDSWGDQPEELPVLAASDDWQSLVTERGRFKSALTSYLTRQRWFLGRSRKRKAVHIADAVPLAEGSITLVLLEVSYVDGSSETYAFPISFVPEVELGDHQRQQVIARVELRRGSGDGVQQGVLIDAFGLQGFTAAVLDLFGRQRRAAGRKGRLVANSFRRSDRLRQRTDGAPSLEVDAFRTHVTVDDRLVIRILRNLDQGVSPDVEVSRYLSEKAGFAHIPTPLGAIEHQQGKQEGATTIVVQRSVPDQGTAWLLCTEALARYYEHILSTAQANAPRAAGLPHPSADVPEVLPAMVSETIGTMIPLVRLLAQRTAELHLALGSETDDPAFAPEAITQLIRRSMYQSARTRLRRTFDLMRARVRTMPDDQRPLADTLLALQPTIDQRLKRIVGSTVASVRTRIHGDLHLGQVRYTGKDFVFFDFDGDRGRPISERRFKGTPLRDVAATLRSFDYAAQWELLHRARPEDVENLRPWAEFWSGWVSAVYLASYREHVGEARFVPAQREDWEALLDLCLVDKCVYELGYELQNRPEWVMLPLRGLLRTCGGED